MYSKWLVDMSDKVENQVFYWHFKGSKRQIKVQEAILNLGIGQIKVQLTILNLGIG
jgi:hypothetical protein